MQQPNIRFLSFLQYLQEPCKKWWHGVELVSSTNIIIKRNQYDKGMTLGTLIVIVLEFIFVFSALFMPTDNYNIKKIFFVLIIIVCMPSVIRKMKISQFAFLDFMSIGFPLVFILISVLCFNNSFNAAFTIGHCGIYFLLFFAISDDKYEYQQVVLTVLKIEVLITFISGLLHYSGLVPIQNNTIFQFLRSTSNAMVGSGYYWTSFGLMAWLKSSPLFILLLSDCLQKKKYLWAVITCAGIYFSGSRANVFTMIILVFAYAIMYHPQTKAEIILKTFIIAVILGGMIFMLPKMALSFSDIMTRRSRNDIVRTGYFSDLISLYKEKPLSIIWGTGFGSELYVSYYGEYRRIIELSFIDILRQIGLIGMIPFLYFIFFPVKSIALKSEWTAFAYILYIIIAATNPLLYSSTAYVVYIYAYLYYYYESISSDLKEYV